MRLDKFEFSHAFAEQTLKGPIATRLVTEKGQQTLARARTMYGATNYGMRVKVGAKRVHAFVFTTDRYSRNSNRLHNTLKKALW